MKDIPDTQFVKVSDESPSTPFTIMTYNTLAKPYAKASEFPYTPLDLLSFEIRAPRIIKEIASYPADILCFQEVDQYEFYKTELSKMGYAAYWKKKSKEETPDGVLIAYKREKFELLGEYEIEFDKMPDLPDFDLKRGTVALALHLNHLPSKRQLLCVNTHIFWPHTVNHIKYAQMSYLLKETVAIHSKLPNSSKIAVVLCGDLNVWPDSNVIRLLYGLPPSLKYPDIKTEEHKKVLEYFWKGYSAPLIELKSAYELYQNALKGKREEEKKGEQGYEDVVKGHPPYTCITFDEYETLDYIFYDRTNMKVTALSKVEEGVKVTPNEVYPSDHVRLIAEFDFAV